MRAEDFARLITDCYQVGYMEAVRAYEPALDWVRASELKAWLRLMHIEPRRFRRLVEAGLVRPVRRGTGRNSPICYSKAEIKRALLTAGVTTLYAMEKFNQTND